MIRLPNGHCPVCLSKIVEFDVDRHGSLPDTAVQNFWCPKCGKVVKSVTYSLKPKPNPDKPP